MSNGRANGKARMTFELYEHTLPGGYYDIQVWRKGQKITEFIAGTTDDANKKLADAGYERVY